MLDVVEDIAIGARGLGSIPRQLKSNTVSPTARHRYGVFWKCVTQALNSGDIDFDTC